jgi:DNA-binding beta-propeller fold protein YncE
MHLRRHTLLIGSLLLLSGVCWGGYQQAQRRLGKQPDGSFVVSTGQRVVAGSIAFDGRPTDIALHPSEEVFAVLNQSNVFLATPMGIVPNSKMIIPGAAGFHGLLWSPHGKTLYASLDNGIVQSFRYENRTLTLAEKISLNPEGEKENPRPGGMAITRDGRTLFVVTMDRNSVTEIETATLRRVREYPVGILPFEVRLSEDEKTLVVSNWGGRPVKDDDDDFAASGNTMIVVNEHGSAATGSISIINRSSGEKESVAVGEHPTGMVLQGDTIYVANAASDSISLVSLSQHKLLKTLPLKWGKMNLFGSMPCAMALFGKTLYVLNMGDNAIAEIDLQREAVRGFRPVGFAPIGIALSSDGKTAYVVNTKGNGSTRQTTKGLKGKTHDFQGTVSIVDLQSDLKQATQEVAANNHWQRDRSALNPPLAVYQGAIKHVLYIIKENRTYDQVFGDMPQGNGDPNLCDLGRTITPNHHALAEQFTLFDNAYTSGTNSADGHAWSTQALANDYLEHFYTGYRTYPDDGDCAMALSASGQIWEKAIQKGKTFRNYGEYCDNDLAVFTPNVKSWLEVWKDRQSGKRRIATSVNTRVANLRPYVHPNVVYWPLLQSDQQRADYFIGEYKKFSREGRVPNFMILTLPCDHTEGRDPNYPKPQSMVADNDLALGRVVEAISHSPEWKNTCIFVIEDDSQSGYDHVDGHRTVYMAISPYTRRKFVSHEMNTTVSMLRSIEKMLGLDPMNRFDALTPPITECFSNTPDYTPYSAVPNRIRLDDMNPPLSQQSERERYWTRRSLALDWRGPDRADPDTLNRVIWHTLHGVNTPYPERN